MLIHVICEIISYFDCATLHNDGNYFFVCFVLCISRLSVFEFHLKELLTI